MVIEELENILLEVTKKLGYDTDSMRVILHQFLSDFYEVFLLIWILHHTDNHINQVD